MKDFYRINSMFKMQIILNACNQIKSKEKRNSIQKQNTATLLNMLCATKLNRNNISK